MNLIDFLIIAILLFCFLIGLSRGFAVSFLSFVASIASWLGAWIFYPVLSKIIVKQSPSLIETIINYTSSSKLIEPLESRTLSVSAINTDNIENLIDSANLPDVFSRLLEKNIINQSLSEYNTIGEYFDLTIANIIINICSFVLLFIIIKIVFAIIISIANNITKIPGLRQFDSLAGGVMAIAYSFFFLFLIFALLPIITTIAQIDAIDLYIDGSKYAHFFINHNVFTNLIRGVL